MNSTTLDINSPANCTRKMPWQPRPKNSTEPLWRDSRNPIMGRNTIPGSNSVYNSAVVPYQGAYAGVFRIDQRSGLPYLHTGFSRDGIKWDLDTNKIDLRDENGSHVELGYAYDPRVTPIDDGFIVVWCNDFHGPTIAIAYTEDFQKFTFKGNAFVPFNRNGVLFPRRINGLYTILHRPSDAGHTPFGDIFLSQSPDLKFWGEHRHVMGPNTGGGWWDCKKIGGGPVPIETKDGWLVIYHGVMGTCNGFNYSIGAALLDLDEPSHVLARANQYLLAPEENYEITGRVPNVCFPCAALVDAPTGKLALYYGAADTHTAIAYGYVQEIVDFVKTNNCVG